MQLFMGSVEGRLYAGMSFDAGENHRRQRVGSKLGAVANIGFDTKELSLAHDQREEDLPPLTVVGLVFSDMQNSPYRVKGYLGYRGTNQAPCEVTELAPMSRPEFEREFGEQAVQAVFPEEKVLATA